MGPPNQSGLPANAKGSQGPHRETSPQQVGEKTSLELLLESTERGAPFAEVHQFEMLRDSLVFNHERILQHNHPLPLHETPTGLSSHGTHHYPSLNPIQSQPNNYAEEHATLIPLPVEDEYDDDTFPKLYSTSDRSAQNRENANLDKHVGWTHTPALSRGNTDDFRSTFTRAQLPFNTSGDIPLTTTAASLHLPSPPTSDVFRGEGEMAPLSATTVTTVYAYKCNRTGRQCGNDETPLNASVQDTLALYEERTQEVPYPYNSQGVGPQLLPANEPAENGESEEQIIMEVEEQEQDINNMQSHDVEAKLNTTNLMTTQAPGDYATDEDLDDDLINCSVRQQQPVFPNLADLKWPDPTYLKSSLDPKFHPFLEPNCKKDCRVWLWKGEKGRKAREQLALGKVSSNTSLSSYKRVHSNATSTDVHNTIKAFSDNDELDDADMTVSLGQ